MAKIPTNQEQLDKEKQAEIEAKKRAEQEELEKARKEQEELEKAEEELARNKKTTITMINPHQHAEPKEAEVHPDMMKHWEQEGWTVK